MPNKIEEKLRADARLIREHVPDERGSFRAVATDCDDPEKAVLAGPSHAATLDKAADEIERLKGKVEDLSRQLAAQKDFAASIAWTGAEAQEALATIQAEARRDGVRLVHLKRCIANAARSSGKAGSDA